MDDANSEVRAQDVWTKLHFPFIYMVLKNKQECQR